MSVPIFAVQPISLESLFKKILATTTCVGLPFVSSKPCSQQLIRSPKSKRLPLAKNKLDDVLQLMDDGKISITKENISKLKYVAKSGTCSDHQSLVAVSLACILPTRRFSQAHKLEHRYRQMERSRLQERLLDLYARLLDFHTTSRQDMWLFIPHG